MIENIAFGDVDSFEKQTKKRYYVENYNSNQLDFPLNPLSFKFLQYSLSNKLEECESYTDIKIIFHAILGMN